MRNVRVDMRMENILLSDCTLGFGAVLVEGRLPEATILSAHRLLNKSGVGLFETGLLRSHSFGPNAAVYDSTLLPQEINRHDGTLYAMLLDEYTPEAAKIPKRSTQTVDVIRVRITRKLARREISYCDELAQKGYMLCLLIEETAQYPETELRVLLRDVSRLKPWGCFIVDDSGILRADTLAAVQEVFDSELPPSTVIGFHASDNLNLAMTLAKQFCKWDTDRVRCLDVGAAGFAKGAGQLPLAETAKWMNHAMKTSFVLPYMIQLEEFFTTYMATKKTPGAKLGYYSSAVVGCTYLYTEYYSSLEVDVSEHENICAELAAEDAFSFDKHAANRALLKYRKKKLNIIIIIIPTANRPYAVDGLLFNSVKDLLRCGVDILIYDSSDDDRTYAVTRNFQIEGYDNVYYKRYTGEYDGVSIDNKVITAFREHLNYDYIWCMRDGCVPTVSRFYADLMRAVNSGADYIAVDALHRNNYRYCYKRYDNCLDFFVDNSARATILGSIIFKSTIMKEIIEKYPLDKTNYCFWTPMAPFYNMAGEKLSAVLIISNVFSVNPCGALRSYWMKNLLMVYAGFWRNEIKMLPSAYDLGKMSALKIQMSDFHPFHLRSILALRANGGFNLAIYKKYQQSLSEVSDIPPWKYRMAATMPKPIAGILVNWDRRALLHPEKKSSRLFYKLYNIYYRLGR